MKIAMLPLALLLLTFTAGLRPLAAQALPQRNPTVDEIVRNISPERIRANIEKLVSFGTRHSLSATDNPTRGIGAARNWIKAEFESYSQASGGRLKVEFDPFEVSPAPRVPQKTTMMNIVATLEGESTPERIFVVGGHYDSRNSDGMDVTADAPGANDDGSGTAVVLELARVLSRYRFRSTLVFIAFAGEEQGLYGSKHWAGRAREKDLHVVAMLNNDIVGNIRGGSGIVNNTEVRVFSEGVPPNETPEQARLRIGTGSENDSASRQLARYLAEQTRRYVSNFDARLMYRRDRYLRGGDHIPFNEAGFAAVRCVEPNEDYNHQHQTIRTEDGVRYGDLPEFVSPDYIAQVARVNAATLSSLALAAAQPENVRLLATKLENDTTLEWDAVADSNLAGYEIVLRETSAPEWQRKILVGNVTRYTLEGISKDNYQFGVQAVDTEGNESLVAFPRPVTAPRE